MNEPIEKETSTAKPISPKPIITDKLLEFQKRVAAIPKDSTNPFFKSKYFDVNTVISAIKPILNEVGLVVSQPTTITDIGGVARNVLQTIIKDGSETLLHSDVLIPDISDIQKLGAAITYLRRYCLVSILLLEGEEDDDGNGTVKAKTTQTSTPAPKMSKKAEFDATEPLENDWECPVHGKTIKLIPAGVTKQGKAYAAFHSCTAKVEGKFCREKPEQVIQMEPKEIQFDKPYNYPEGD